MANENENVESNGAVRIGDGEVDARAGLMDAVYERLGLPAEVEADLRGSLESGV